MVELVTRYRTSDGFEYDTEKQAILHENHQKEIKDLVEELTIHTPIWTEEAIQVAEYIITKYKLEKRSCLG